MKHSSRSCALLASSFCWLSRSPLSAARRRRGSAAATRLAILPAEDRRAPTPRDLAAFDPARGAADAQTARIAVRALGRLERPALIADIVPLLKHPLPEIRAEAANAIGQAAQGWKHQPPSTAPRHLDAAVAALTARLNVEADPNVRAAICETLGRLPYATAEQVQKAEQTLLGLMARSQTVADRLGVARGLEALVRLHRKLSPPDADLIAALQALASVSASAAVSRSPRAHPDICGQRGGSREGRAGPAPGDDGADRRRGGGRGGAPPRRGRSGRAGAPARDARGRPAARIGSTELAAAVLRQGLADAARWSGWRRCGPSGPRARARLTLR